MATSDTKSWFYLHAGRREGPLALGDLVARLLAEQNPENTLVWQQGMQQWTAAGEVPAVAQRLPPPIPVGEVPQKTPVRQRAETSPHAPLSRRPAANEYRSLRVLAGWLIGSLSLFSLASIAGAVVATWQIDLLETIRVVRQPSDFAINQVEDALSKTGGIYFLAYLATAILFAAFIHRGNQNARALGASPMRFSPAGSIGWAFVPVANLFMPYQAVREIWTASDPHAPALHKPATVASPLLKGWWAALLVHVFLLGGHPKPATEGHLKAGHHG